MSKVVFVGNVPYNMSEEELIDVFKSVGEVVGFRLVFDRETGKPRGYGFCEFADHETALSAVRNLNNIDVKGRNLRIDLADSDPQLEGKTTVRGELVDGPEMSRARPPDPKAFLNTIPPGIPVPPGSTCLDTISHILASMPPGQLMEVLAQMKSFVLNNPDAARALLQAHPQLAYALFQALLLNNIVDPAILQRMLAATSKTPPAAPAPTIVGQYGVPPTMGGGPGNMGMGAPPGMGYQGMPPAAPTPPPGNMYGRPQQGYPPPASNYYQPPPQQQQQQAPPPAAAAPAPDINDTQRAMLMQVLTLSQQQIDAMPDAERGVIQQLRNQFMGTLGGVS
ncbi:hypothetical protein BD626DRAFT_484591 [Schizophyllum amplum]|uniref:RRM domain-containing protein n=1 Tax=Schizophyllum amplum TaxID=97359 RepID=A0A550CQI1_9AGAR|nr:hypothetical protein BD626DRAFT_484591 [Auriculariopsis ampla]